MTKTDSLKLKDQVVVLLRPIEQTQELANQLKLLGASVIHCPLIELIPQEKEIEKINLAFLRQFTALIFTSANGIRIFADSLEKKAIDLKQLEKKDIYVIGPKTKEACEKIGFSPKELPDTFQSEGLIERIGDALNGQKVLILNVEGARKILPTQLESKGAHVTTLHIYKNIQPTPSNVIVHDHAMIMFTSPSTVERFFESNFYRKQPIISFCIGNVTADAVKKHVTSNIYISNAATIESLIEKMIEYAGGKK